MKIFVTVLLLCVLEAQAQQEPYQAFPCGAGNPRLKDLLNGAVLKETIYLGCYGEGTHSLLCSSMLKSGGKPPARPTYAGLDEEAKTARKEEYEASYDHWSCQYSPINLTDGNLATAWAEGVSGDGVGELVLVRVDVSQKLSIWSGYGKSQALYTQNTRPRKVRLHLIKVKVDYPQCGDLISELSLAASSTPVMLRDLNGFQDLPQLPPAKQVEGYTYMLGIEIVEVYPGTKYKDLCISEVRAAQ